MVAIGLPPPLSQQLLDRALNPRALAVTLVADFTERPVLLEEQPGLLVAHPQRDQLPAAPALAIELDHHATIHVGGLPGAPSATVAAALTRYMATVVPPLVATRTQTRNASISIR